MSDFFGDLLVKAVPFIIPVLLVLSFFVNHGGTLPSGGGGEEKPEKEQKQKPAKKEAPPAKPAKQEEKLDAPISDEDMT